MAQKKFSRLSIMLEAQDGMSKPMQNAAAASQQLQKSVQQLNSSLSSNSNGANQLNKSLQNAQSTTKSFGTALKEFASNSAAAYVAGLALSKSWNAIRNLGLNVGYVIGDLGKRVATFIAQTRPVQALVSTFNNVSTAVKTFGQNMIAAMRTSNAWVGIKTAVEQVRTKVNDLVITTKTYAGLVPLVIKNTAAYKALDAAVTGVKLKVTAVSLAFTLWKNSSTFVQKLTNDITQVKTAFSTVVSSMGSGIQNILSKFGLMKKSVDDVNKSLTQTSNRRATFNQLADANAKLNAQLEKMNQQLQKSQGLFSKMSQGIKSIAGLEKLRTGVQAITGIFDQTKGLVGGAVQQAAQQKFDKASFGIVLGDQQKGDQYLKTIQDYAAGTSYTSNDWAASLRTVGKKIGNTDDLKKYMQTIEQLVTLMPEQGLQGAAFAMRELQGGQVGSLANRFDISKQYLNPLKKVTDPMQQASMLSDILDKQYGFGVNQINEMKQQPLMQLNAMKGHVTNIKGNMAQGILAQVAPAITDFNKAYQSGKFNNLIQSVSTGLGKATAAVMNFGKNIFEIFSSGQLQSKAAPFMHIFTDIKDAVIKAWPNIKAIIMNVGQIFVLAANDINRAWPKVWPVVNKVLQDTIKVVKIVTDQIVKHWPTVISIVEGVAGAFVAWKIVSGITTTFGALQKVMALWRAGTLLATVAQWALNTALLANPVGLIITLVAGLVIGFIALYKNNEAFRDSVNKCFTWLKTEGVKALDIGRKAINAIGAEFQNIKTYIDNAFDSFMSFVERLKGTKINLGALVGQGGPLVQLGPVTTKSHRDGLNYVPYDGYGASLHQGERVLTAQQNKDYNNNQNGVVITGNTFHVRQESDIEAVAQSLFDKLYSAKTAMG